MALTTYTELQTAIAAWLQRTDLAAAQVQEFIRLAEERMTYDLAKLAFMQRTPTAIALAQGATSFDLPDDIAELITAHIVETGCELDIVPAADLQREAARLTTLTGTPRICAISGSTDDGELLVSVWPTADAAYTVQVTGAAAVPALSGSRATNFVLKRAPGLYLYGSLLASEAFTVNDQRLSTWEAMYGRALDRFTSLRWDGDVMLATDVPVGRGYGYNILEG